MFEYELYNPVRQLFDPIYAVSDTLFHIFLYILVAVSAFYLVMTLYSAFVKVRKPEFSYDDKDAPFVTVQIPTYNELVALKCAEHCLAFDYPEDKYEIIIGDDSNHPEVSAEIDCFAAAHNNVKVTRRGSNAGFKPGNLNYMLKHSNGEILVIFDSDFMPSMDFLRRIVAPFLCDPNVAAVQARWDFTNPDQNLITSLGAVIVSLFHHAFLPFVTGFGGSAFIGGSAEAVRKDVLVKRGGWQDCCMTEDIEFSLHLIKEGYKIEYLKGLNCPGELPYTPKDLYKQQMRWAYGVISSLRKHAKGILVSRKIGVKDKVFTCLISTGYLFSVLLVLLFITGMVSFITHEPAPFDFVKFFSETGANILLTSGLVISSVIVTRRSRSIVSNIKNVLKVVAASFSYGLVVTLYVNFGILKVFLNKPMQWYMLNKSGNSFRVK